MYAACGGQGQRPAVAHDPLQARKQTDERCRRIAELEALASHGVAMLQAQDAGEFDRGRKLTDGGVTARLLHQVCKAGLSRGVAVQA